MHIEKKTLREVFDDEDARLSFKLDEKLEAVIRPDLERLWPQWAKAAADLATPDGGGPKAYLKFATLMIGYGASSLVTNSPNLTRAEFEDLCGVIFDGQVEHAAAVAKAKQ